MEKTLESILNELKQEEISPKQALKLFADYFDGQEKVSRDAISATLEKLAQSEDDNLASQKTTHQLLQSILEKEYPEQKDITVPEVIEVKKPQWLGEVIGAIKNIEMPEILPTDLSPISNQLDLVVALLAELCQSYKNEPQEEEESKPAESSSVAVRVRAKNNINEYSLTGTIDGIKTDFFLPFAPKRGHLILMRNNVPQKLGADYTFISGNGVRYANPMQVGEDHWAWMIK